MKLKRHGGDTWRRNEGFLVELKPGFKAGNEQAENEMAVSVSALCINMHEVD